MDIVVRWDIDSERWHGIKDCKNPKKSPLVKARVAERVTTLDLSEYGGYVGDYVFHSLNNLKKIIIKENSRYNISMLAFDSTQYIECVEIAPYKYYTGQYRLQLYNLPTDNSKSYGLSGLRNKVGCYIVASNNHGDKFEKECFDLIKLGEQPVKENNSSEKIGMINQHPIYKYKLNDSTGFVSTSPTNWNNNFAAYFWWNRTWGSTIRAGNYKDGELEGKGVQVNVNTLGDSIIWVGTFSNGSRTKGYTRWRKKDGTVTLIYGEERTYRDMHCKGCINWGLGGKCVELMEDGSIRYGIYEASEYKDDGADSLFLSEFLEFPEVVPFDIVANNYVKYKVSEWQKKDEFETTNNWRQRVTEKNYNRKAQEYFNEVHDIYIINAAAKIDGEIKLGLFDADNNTYIVKTKLGDYIVALTGIASPQFIKSNWSSIVAVPTYIIGGNGLEIKELTFRYKDKVVARYDNTKHYNYNIVNIDYVFNTINIPSLEDKTKPITVDTIRLSTKSDVDVNIPQTLKRNKTTYAFIIANENYETVRSVPFALNDGRVFAQYCTKTLGIDRKNVIMYENASSSNIIECVELMKSAAKANNGSIDIIFYYAGHAFPDESTKSAYLLPVDGNYTIPRTCYSVKQLYSDLDELQVNSVVCFIDACFSGTTREDETLLTGRGVAIKVKEDVPLGNVVAFTSSTGAETAHQYYAKSHGMFTYFLLKKLQDSKGNVTLGQLSDYIIENVKKTSFDDNKKIQTPTVKASPKLQDTWRNIKL